MSAAQRVHLRRWRRGIIAVVALPLIVVGLTALSGQHESSAGAPPAVDDHATDARDGLRKGDHAERHGSAAAAAGSSVVSAHYGRVGLTPNWSRIQDRSAVNCEPPERIVFGESYQLEHHAEPVPGMALNEGYAEIDRIWLHNPRLPSGASVDITPLTDEGLQMC